MVYISIIPDPSLKQRLKNLNVEIKNHFYERKRKNVRRNIVPGNGKSLWKAVLEAKDVNEEELPNKMFENGVQIETNELEEAFAELFESKVKQLSDKANIDENVYNGWRKLPEVYDYNFMTEINVKKAMQSLKLKNAEGHDRIPQRLLIDGAEILNEPMTTLFKLIYAKKIRIAAKIAPDITVETTWTAKLNMTGLTKA